MERMLKAVPADLKAKMEALVLDLASALDEDTAPRDAAAAGASPAGPGAATGARRRLGIRRRAHSAGNLSLVCRQRDQNRHGAPSEDSSSSVGEATLSRSQRGLSSLQHSDSDEGGPGGDQEMNTRSDCLRPAMHTFCLLQPRLGLGPESDSLNENFSPATNAYIRRKRKFKRMAVDPCTSGSANPSSGPPLPIPRPLPAHKKKARVTAALRRANCENRLGNYVLLCGKRKRSARERGLQQDCGIGSGGERRRTRHVLALRKLSLSDAPTPATTQGAGDLLSSSSLSSSESDTGLYTNDEGREGDDEQSDWFGGSASWWDEEDEDDTSPEHSSESSFAMFLSGSNLPHLPEESRTAGRTRPQSLSGREIRAGRRRLRPERPGFSVLTSANEKLSRFLQDSGQSELRLHPMQAPERAQLGHLAALYSLEMHTDGGSRPVLTKTCDTMRAVRVDQLMARPHSYLCPNVDFKRRRRLPPLHSQPQPMDLAETSPSESGIGHPDERTSWIQHESPDLLNSTPEDSTSPLPSQLGLEYKSS